MRRYEISDVDWERYGNRNSVFQRFRRWSMKGVWQQVFDALQEPDLDWLLIDFTMVRAHHSGEPSVCCRTKNNSPG